VGWLNEGRVRRPALSALAVVGIGSAVLLARLSSRVAPIVRGGTGSRHDRVRSRETGVGTAGLRRQVLAGSLVRAGAVSAVAAAFVVPLVRHRYRIPPAVTVVATTVGPLALSVLQKRTNARDSAMYMLQMWAFTMNHELPYDNPEALRGRLRIEYPIKIDKFLGAGELPNVRLQRRFADPGRVGPLDRFLSVVHWAWFGEPHLVLLCVMKINEERFPNAARQMAAVYHLGAALYAAVPTAPPWWAAEQGRTGAPVRRLMAEVGEETWGRAWPKLYEVAGGNPWAAMPSLHFASSVMAAILLSECDRVLGAAAWAYALTLGVALIHLGEHYVTDLLAGLAVVAVVRQGEPHAEPVARKISELAQKLERIANGNGGAVAW
jgi:membrane-associated phospholipid phosphatase